MGELPQENPENIEPINDSFEQSQQEINKTIDPNIDQANIYTSNIPLQDDSILPLHNQSDELDTQIQYAEPEFFQFDKEENAYVDELGHRWMTKKTLARKIGISPTTISKYLDEVVSRDIKLINARIGTVYREEDVLALDTIKNFFSFPQVDKHTKIYTEGNWRRRF